MMSDSVTNENVRGLKMICDNKAVWPMKNTLIVEHTLLVNYSVLFLHLLIGLVIVKASFSLKLGS